MPVDDLGTPSPHKGSICYEKEIDRFSICYIHYGSIQQEESKGDRITPLIFGLDIGTTSIGFAVIDHDSELATGKIHRLGVRIFPEARDPKGVPLNQERRQARLRRRQLRRRRERRRLLAAKLQAAGLLPSRQSPAWDQVMSVDPWDLRKRASEGETLSLHETGRAIYHLAQRRHFKGRDIDEVSDTSVDTESASDADENKVKSKREQTVQELDREGKTLGAWLAARGPHERKRGEHVTRKIVEDEFEKVWKPLIPQGFCAGIRDAIFAQRPIFWRLKTLGRCRLVPGARLCRKGSWLSQQRRMLEKLNNLALGGRHARPLDLEERDAILARLRTQASMTWPGVRQALASLYRSRGKAGENRALKFNLEDGGEKKLLGNPIEAKLAEVFGDGWQEHPRIQEIRDSLPNWIWQADYEEVGGTRVVIRPKNERAERRAAVAKRFIAEFGLSDTQASNIETWKLPSGWEPYSVEALESMLPHLEAGARFGELVNSPSWEGWRNKTFPGREQPTGEVCDRLPSSADRDEREYVASLRNPTVVRVRSELRKVVNNLIDLYGKPELIRIEVARDVGNSKREREEKAFGIRRQERSREAARKGLREEGIAEPTRADIEKWMLWKECDCRCPYTGDTISFDALFSAGEFEVEHIWPRSRSLDDSYRNKTLCRRDVNIKKGSQTPHELFQGEEEKWAAVAKRLEGMKARAGRPGMSPSKIRRFLAPAIPDNFADRQLNDTGYAAREAVAYCKKLWPDEGLQAAVKVFAVSGRVTGYLRRLWGLNNVLSTDGEKTRADHRHHAIDALVVACCHLGITQKLSRFWQKKDDPHTPQPHLPPPWTTIRIDAEQAVADVVVSHRVRKKLSGPLHKETVYGDTKENICGATGQEYRLFVSRSNLENLTRKDLKDNNKALWPDQKLREIIVAWVNEHGDGDPKKAFPPYPKRGRKGSIIRKVRLQKKRQIDLMAKVSTGYSELRNNHHVAFYLLPDETVESEIVSLQEALRRKAQNKSVVRRKRSDGAKFVMSLSLRDTLQFTKNGETKLRVVESIWSSGQIVMVDHDDAKGLTRFRPSAKYIISNGGRKVSVDPVGRIRPAND